MLETISAQRGEADITVSAHMDDQEITSFLRQLAECENQSRKRSQMIS
jgi:hypothetical protein